MDLGHFEVGRDRSLDYREIVLLSKHLEERS